MDQFDANRGCAKCGSSEPGNYEYHKKGKRRQLGGLAEGPLLCPADEEHMHRTCGACKYEWAEAPLA